MDQPEMLLQVVLSVKSAFLASRGVMMLNMVVVWIILAAKYAAKLATLRMDGPRFFRGAYPPLKSQMDRIFMALPVVLLMESFSAKGTLEWRWLGRPPLSWHSFSPS
jgi:hypothetical protein